MSVKLLSERMNAAITDEDQLRIDEILAFWFKERELSAPQIDHRMDIWFGEDEVFDHECKKMYSSSGVHRYFLPTLPSQFSESAAFRNTCARLGWNPFTDSVSLACSSFRVSRELWPV